VGRGPLTIQAPNSRKTIEHNRFNVLVRSLTRSSVAVCSCKLLEACSVVDVLQFTGKCNEVLAYDTCWRRSMAMHTFMACMPLCHAHRATLQSRVLADGAGGLMLRIEI
jgi:hypothetical protein